MKASLLGAGLTIPITDGRFHLGTWQGIWLCEHRDHPCTRFHPARHPRAKAKVDHQLYLRGCVALRVCCVVGNTATRNIVVTIQGMKQDS